MAVWWAVAAKAADMLTQISSLPATRHEQAMSRVNSESKGISEKTTAESFVGSVNRERPLAQLAVAQEEADVQAEIDIATAMTGREGGVMEQQVAADSARAAATVDKQLDIQETEALNQVYANAYDNMYQKEVNKIQPPGIFWGLFD